MKFRASAVLCAVLLTASGCAGTNQSDVQTTAPETEITTTETSAETTVPETTQTEAETSAESAPETTASAEATEQTGSETGTAYEFRTTAPIATNPAPADDDTKLLWSERGLEIVPKDSEDGYGEELPAGSEYIGWTLKSFDGTTDGTAVSSLHADFTRSSALSVNGILTVFADSNADWPNGLYLRVDNQADFPYFPADTRERGKFLIENAQDVYDWLKLEAPPVSEQYDIAVTVTVESLHVHYAEGGYDTIRVTSASKR